MRVVTQNVKIELGDDERIALDTARCILKNFVDTMRDYSCDYAFFKRYGMEYDKSILEDTIDLLDAFIEGDPTIE